MSKELELSNQINELQMQLVKQTQSTIAVLTYYFNLLNGLENAPNSKSVLAMALFDEPSYGELNPEDLPEEVQEYVSKMINGLVLFNGSSVSKTLEEVIKELDAAIPKSVQ